MLDLGMDFGIENSVLDQKVASVSKPTVQSILENIESAIALDISKLQTGITIKENNEIKHYTISLLTEYSDDDPFCEIKMRKEFAQKLKPFVEGKHFQIGAVEDVFGGVNYQTTRKLLALNTVFDEFIYDGVCKVDEFYKWGNKLWKKYFRRLVKIKGYPDDKEEIRQIFDFLEYDFYMANKHRKADDIQDMLDSCGLLCAVALFKSSGEKSAKKKSIKMNQIQLYCLEDEDDIDYLQDIVVSNVSLTYTELKGNIKRAIKNRLLESNEDVVFYSNVDNGALGTLALDLDLTLSPYGASTLVFYRKALKQAIKKAR